MFREDTSQNQWWQRAVVCIALLFTLSTGIFAQDITSGSIQGTVSDEHGGTVAGATVEAKNTATNFSRTFTTESDGRFTFLSMPPGRYVVTVTKQGFAKLTQENIELTEETQAKIRDNVAKLVEFTKKVETNSRATSRRLWSESEESLPQKLISRLQKVQ